MFVHIGAQPLHLVLHILDLLPAFDIKTDVQQRFVYQHLLQVGVEPDHMSVRKDRVVFGLHAGHVVHARSPAARPVGAVRPRAVEPPPFGVGAQRGEDLVQAVDIAELAVVRQLDPRQQVRAGRSRIVTLETVGAVGPDFAADEAVGVLLRIEVVQRTLEREEAVAVAGEHHHERGVPHENIAVVGDIQIRRDEFRSLLRLADVAHGDPPSMPVHLDLFVVPLPHGCGQDLAGLGERTGLDGFGLGGPEFVFGHEDLLYIGILVRQLVRTRFKALRSGRSRCEDQRQKRRDLFA